MKSLVSKNREVILLVVGVAILVIILVVILDPPHTGQDKGTFRWLAEKGVFDSLVRLTSRIRLLITGA